VWFHFHTTTTIIAINGTTIDDAALQHVVVGPQKTFVFSRP